MLHNRPCRKMRVLKGFSRRHRHHGRTFYLRAALIFACTVASAAAQGTRADDPDFLSFGVGHFDWNSQKSLVAEFRLEYRSNQKVWIFKPMGGLMGASDGAVYAYAGVGIDVFFGRSFVIYAELRPGLLPQGQRLGIGLRVGVPLAD